MPRHDVFLSYASADKPVVEALARRLRTLGFEPWLDTWNLIPGEPWQEAIEKALEECATCAVCLGPSGTGPWQNEEMRTAIDRRVADRSHHFRVIPVLLPGSERGEASRLPAFLRATTWVEFRDTLDDDKALHRLVSGIRGLPPGADPGEAVAQGAQPYRGLQVFDVGDTLFFFGREALTEWLLDKLRADRSGNRFLAIVGPSGSGKSSLARAGLVAALKRGEMPGSDAWPVAICKPGAQPLESLAVALSGAGGAARLGDSPSAVLSLIRDLGENPSLLHLTTRLSLRDAPADRRLVVLVDQFEEIFTLCPDEEQRKAIIANLLHAATVADGQTLVVLTLRADFYGRCAAYPDLATAVSDRQSLVGPMTRDELRSAIERPAYLAGCELEGGLTDLLLNEVESQPGSLPLLEHALLQIWQRREGGRRLTVAAYREIGGVAGALEKQAEEIYSGFTEEEREACRWIFLRLVQVDEQGRATKRRLNLDELDAAPVVTKLIDARLLTTDREKRPTVEVAHEALLGNWGRLKEWIEQDQEALRTRRRLDEAVAEWIAEEHDSSFLLEGGRLAQAEEWSVGHPGEMGQEARDFIAASVAARDRERRRQRVLTIAACVIAAFAMLAASAALYSRHLAEKEKRIAVAGDLSERSRTVFATNPQLGLLLATQALKMARDAGEPYLPSAQSALHWALSKSGGIPLPSGRAVAVLLTRDRKFLITYGVDRHLRRWDLRNETVPVSGEDFGEMPPDTLPQLAASPSGQWLLIAGQQGSRLLNAQNPTVIPSEVRSLKGEDWIFKNDPFSPNGRWLATRRGADLIIRDLKKPEEPIAFAIQCTKALLYRFSPDSSVLAIAAEDKLIEVDLSSLTSTPSEVKLPPNYGPQHLAFQADGTLIVVGRGQISEAILAIHRDGTILGPNLLRGCLMNSTIVPDLPNMSILCQSFVDSSSGIWKAVAGVDSESEVNWPFMARGIVASPDERQLALIDYSGNVYIESHPGKVKPSLGLFTTQAPASELVGFSKGSRWLITSSPSEAPRFWDTRQGQGLADFEPRVHRISEAFLPILTAKGEYPRWDLSIGQLRLSTLNGYFVTKGLKDVDAHLSTYAVSADGRWFAGATSQGVVKLWKIEPDGATSPPVAIAKSRFSSLSFSPYGTWLAVGGNDGERLLWNLNALRVPPLHLTNSFGLFPIAFSPEGNTVATGSLGGVRMRVLGSQSLPLADSPSAPSRGAIIAPQALAFSNDGKWLAIGGENNGKIQVWTAPHTEIYLENREAAVDLLAFSPDGHWLAAGGKDGVIQLWRWRGDKTNPTPIILPGHSKSIKSIIFTPKELLSGSDDNTIRQWELRTDKLIELGCNSVGRALTGEEGNYYAGPESYQKGEPCPGMPKAPDER